MRFFGRRCAAILVTSGSLVVASALPAVAAESPDWNPPYPYTFLETLGLFVGIPLAVFAIVALAVFAPGWTKKDGADSASGQPVWETSPAGSMAAPSGPGIITPSGPTDHTERGGASARW